MLSVIIPLFSEEESLKVLYEELKTSLGAINHEIIFVDDGSRDNSLEILKEIAKKDKNIKIFSFRKNQGKAEALNLGFQKAKGDYIATLDADLQDKPSDIVKLLGVAQKGFDLVCGWRKDRKDPIAKNISSAFFNQIAKSFWGLNLHDYNCGLKVYKSEAAKSIQLYGGLHRFIPLLVSEYGFSITEEVVEHRKRKYGESKYGFSKLWKDIPDIFTMLFISRYSKRPLHFFGMVGGVFFIIGIIVLIYLSVLRFQGQTIGDRPLLLFGILMVIASFQVFFTGFLADLFLHVNQKTNGKTEEENISLKYKSE